MSILRKAALFIVLPLILSSQGADVHLEFEGASVRPSVTGVSERNRGIRGGPGTGDPGQFEVSYTSMRSFILLAFGVRSFQVVGPSWLDTQMYDLVAKVPAGTTRPQMNQMMQHFLAERFKLMLHHENRDLPAYVMTVGKAGIKMTPAKTTPDQTAASQAPGGDAPSMLKLGKDGFPDVANGLAVIRGRAKFAAHNKSMLDLLQVLRSRMDLPIIDMTGLADQYDFTLYWVTDQPVPAVRSDAQEDGPRLIDALRQQLGLRIERGTAPVDVLVIDRIEKAPTEN